jgi:O-Antigen ligase
VANSIEPINLRSTGGHHLTTRQIGIRFIAPAVGCLLALFVGWFVSSDLNPFITTTILTATVIFIVAVCNPTAGVYFLILTSGYLDLIKRLGVLSDALSGIDVVITLAVAPLLFVCVCVGVVYRNVINRAWLKPWQTVLAAVIFATMAGVFVQAFFRGGGTLFALKDFANSGAYLPLTLVVCLLFPDSIRVERLVTFCLWVYVPVGLYGVWQQFFGLTDFEIDYLKSGFTIEVGLLDDVRLRPFATLNSPHALGVVTAMLSALAAFTPLKRGKWAQWQILVSVLFAIACLATFIRAAWALLAFAVLVWACCRTKVGTIVLYGMALAGFAALMLNSDVILRSLDRMEAYLPQDSDVESQAFRLGTFSDRLVSFRNVLTNPEFHTWFGNRNEVYEDSMEQSHENGAHDQIGQILVSFGFVGLGFFLGVTVLGVVVAHRAIFRQRDLARRRMMLGCLSVLIATLFSGMLFGSHLGLFPVNVFFALLAGCFCALNMDKHRLAETPYDPELTSPDRISV